MLLRCCLITAVECWSLNLGAGQLRRSQGKAKVKATYLLPALHEPWPNLDLLLLGLQAELQNPQVWYVALGAAAAFLCPFGGLVVDLVDTLRFNHIWRTLLAGRRRRRQQQRRASWALAWSGRAILCVHKDALLGQEAVRLEWLAQAHARCLPRRCSAAGRRRNRRTWSCCR